MVLIQVFFMIIFRMQKWAFAIFFHFEAIVCIFAFHKLKLWWLYNLFFFDFLGFILFCFLEKYLFWFAIILQYASTPIINNIWLFSKQVCRPLIKLLSVKVKFNNLLGNLLLLKISTNFSNKIINELTVTIPL